MDLIFSRDRRRYHNKDFDLDLTYIMPNIIAMSYPADRMEAFYKNNINDVAQFLEKMHGGYYKVYNLCSERSYDVRYFRGRVARYPIDDHNPPPVTMMRTFCEDVDQWLSLNPRNIVVIHCYAGKGRTGTMICAYLLYKRIFNTADKAIAYFNEKRMQPGAWAMRPAQQRYVRYFERLIHERFIYAHKQLLLHVIEFSRCLDIAGIRCSTCFTVRHPESKTVFRSRVFTPKSGERGLTMRLATPIIVGGDVKITFYRKRAFVGKKELFWIWFNTYFVGSTLGECYDLRGAPSSAPSSVQAGPAESAQNALWRPAPGRQMAVRNDGSRPGSSFLVSTLNVGRAESAEGGGRCVTATVPERDIDRSLIPDLVDIIPPDFHVKIYFTTVPGS